MSGIFKTGYSTDEEIEKAILIIVETEKNGLDVNVEEVITELKSLATTAGLKVVNNILQKRQRPDPAFFVGKGKLKEIQSEIEKSQADCLIFEGALSPAQQSNLVQYLGIKVLDRTGLILDIFAQRAKSKDGKVQVELAQLNYILPRLSGKGTSLSRLGGGVGTRGPGETKLELDRRYIRKRIHFLKRELEQLKKTRKTQQSQRLATKVPLVALVGYTNAGKSSLLNVLADVAVFEENKLFATLDTTTRSLFLEDDYYKILLTDTVGFISNLPHQLVSAFKSTLDEVKAANLLLHVIDTSNHNWENHLKTVETVLLELEALQKPTIYVFNKLDLLSEDPILPLLKNKYCFISTKDGSGLDKLKILIKEQLFFDEEKFKLIIPYNHGYLIEKIYNIGKVVSIKYKEAGSEIILLARKRDIPNEILKYRVME